MEKPILATNIDGFLIDHSAFIEPHKIWFDRAVLLTKDEGLMKWKGRPDYFIGVNEAMKKIMPDSSKEEQTFQARKWYQEDVIQYIKLHPEVVNKELADSLKELKSKFTLALITTNTRDSINQILEVANLENIYDIVYASSSEEEPSKEKIFKEFKEEYGEPMYYIASRSKEAFEECKKLGTICIYFAIDEINQELKGSASRTITSLEELNKLSY